MQSIRVSISSRILTTYKTIHSPSSSSFISTPRISAFSRTFAMAARNSECVGMQWMSNQQMVLIHGMTGGAWCWFKIKSQLEAFGCRVTCLDLKSCGIDPTDPSTIDSFEEYNQPLHDFLASLPHDHKVVLVGHSAGGISLTRAIHSFPHKIHMAIYICATMLKLGFNTTDDFKIGVPEFKEDAYEHKQGSEELIHSRFRKIFVPEFVPPIISSEDFALSSMLARPAPLRAIVSSKIKEGETKESESVPRVYIKTLRDKVLKPHQQEAMIQKWAPYNVYSVETDHDILFAHPIVLSGLLIRAVSSLAFEKE